MSKITFLPMNVTHEAKKGETILDVAIRCDVPLQHACGGFCACTTCHILVKSGMTSLSAQEGDEIERMERVTEGVQKNSRLGCQAKILGDLVVEVVHLDDDL